MRRSQLLAPSSTLPPPRSLLHAPSSTLPPPRSLLPAPSSTLPPPRSLLHALPSGGCATARAKHSTMSARLRRPKRKAETGLSGAGVPRRAVPMGALHRAPVRCIRARRLGGPRSCTDLDARYGGAILTARSEQRLGHVAVRSVSSLLKADTSALRRDQGDSL